MTDPRARLVTLARRESVSLASLSAMLDRNTNYLQQWVARGTPRLLAERDRRMLANFFGVSQEALGGEPGRARFSIPRLDVAASAGPGAEVGDEALLGVDEVTADFARALGLHDGQAAIIHVAGDSMEPGLFDGDRLLIDQGSRTPDTRGGVYVIRMDGGLLVKRVRRTRGGLIASSDNPSAVPLPNAPIEIIGRAVWQMRRPL